jgi:hypothetical protein
MNAITRIGESKIMYLYEVIILRPDHDRANAQMRISEYYVADHIKDVWAALSNELEDNAAEVESIRRDAPILAILQSETPPAAAPQNKK